MNDRTPVNAYIINRIIDVFTFACLRVHASTVRFRYPLARAQILVLAFPLQIYAMGL